MPQGSRSTKPPLKLLAEGEEKQKREMAKVAAMEEIARVEPALVMAKYVMGEGKSRLQSPFEFLGIYRKKGAPKEAELKTNIRRTEFVKKLLEDEMSSLEKKRAFVQNPGVTFKDRFFFGDRKKIEKQKAALAKLEGTIKQLEGLKDTATKTLEGLKTLESRVVKGEPVPGMRKETSKQTVPELKDLEARIKTPQDAVLLEHVALQKLHELLSERVNELETSKKGELSQGHNTKASELTYEIDKTVREMAVLDLRMKRLVGSDAYWEAMKGAWTQPRRAEFKEGIEKAWKDYKRKEQERLKLAWEAEKKRLEDPKSEEAKEMVARWEAFGKNVERAKLKEHRADLKRKFLKEHGDTKEAREAFKKEWASEKNEARGKMAR